MTDATINDITKEINKHRAKLEELEEKKKKLELELPITRSNLEALTRSLAILKGENPEVIPTGRMLRPIIEEENKKIIKSHSLRKGSSSYLAYLALKPNNSLTLSELFEIVKQKIPELKKHSFESGIYRFIREKKCFKKDDAGKVSILE
jgi:hypothetical protein